MCDSNWDRKFCEICDEMTNVNYFEHNFDKS